MFTLEIATTVLKATYNYMDKELTGEQKFNIQTAVENGDAIWVTEKRAKLTEKGNATYQILRVQKVQQEVREFNNPHQPAVAINCAHIGDDNDFSCTISRVVKALFIAGEIDLAYTMYLTDPLLHRPTGNISKETFVEEMETNLAQIAKWDIL